MQYQVTSPVADVHERPDISAPRGKFETQLVFGEIFIVQEEKDGWCKGICAHDKYAGYVEKKHLSAVSPATHIITAARTHLYQSATIKSAWAQTLGFGSRIAITAIDKDFAQLDNGAWIYQKHIAPLHTVEKDHIATAKKFLETPYYWGGRSGFGIDCSGLVQVSLAYAGIPVPRDTEMQENTVGIKVETPQAGDLVYFPGHVGLMVDSDHLLHANAFHMKVTIEPLKTVAERSKGITSIRRAARP